MQLLTVNNANSVITGPGSTVILELEGNGIDDNEAAKVFRNYRKWLLDAGMDITFPANYEKFSYTDLIARKIYRIELSKQSVDRYKVDVRVHLHLG